MRVRAAVGTFTVKKGFIYFIYDSFGHFNLFLFFFDVKTTKKRIFKQQIESFFAEPSVKVTDSFLSLP